MVVTSCYLPLGIHFPAYYNKFYNISVTVLIVYRIEGFPTIRGFVAKWKATIPVGPKVIVEYGMDIVEVENGKVKRNEVYFNTSYLLSALKMNGGS